MPLLRLVALTVVGLVQARRGEPGRWGPLDEAAGLLAGQTELQYRAPVAAARAGYDDEPALRQALTEFQRLGTRQAADMVARRLRALGGCDVSHGPRAETQSHPAGLTRREAEVLTHLGRGEPNATIAGRLHLSEKTVHHHVSAILRKLGVANRHEAVGEATRAGYLRQRTPRQPIFSHVARSASRAGRLRDHAGCIDR